jgi:hypothetical protein
MDTPIRPASIEEQIELLRQAMQAEIRRIDQRLADMRVQVERAIEICTDRGAQK